MTDNKSSNKSSIADGIDVTSGCSSAGRPFVELHWEDKGAQVSPQNARELAESLLHCAEAAEADAMLLRFFRKMELPDGAWQAMVTEWREWREWRDAQPEETL